MREAPTFCAYCGERLEGDMRSCRACGRPVSLTGHDALPSPATPSPSWSTGTRRGARRAPARRWRVPRRPLIVAGVVVLVGVMAAVALAMQGRGGGTDDTARVPATTATPAGVAAVAAGGDAADATVTPAPATPASSPSPTATGTPAPRLVNGLLIADEQWRGRVVEAGGLRIRSAPRVAPGNVVGSVAQGAEIAVDGRVLNGQEAEPGKGTIWLLVGPNQYIYAAPGYIERLP